MYFSGIKKCDTANGDGIRVSLFVSGCSFACKGCFNSGTWSYKSGKVFDKEAFDELLMACNDPYIDGLSVLGGEPLEPRNVGQVQAVVMAFKQLYPEKSVWLWTGYEMSELTERLSKGEDALEALMEDVDVITDGRFEIDNPTKKPFRGSDNQIRWLRRKGINGKAQWYTNDVPMKKKVGDII